MAIRPISYLNWTLGNPSASIQPPAPFAYTGWESGQAPPPEYMNWLFSTADQWIQYLDELTNTGVPDGAIRLINGGDWSFNASSGALAWSADANLAIPSIPDSSNRIPAGSVTLNDGDVAYITPNEPIVTTGNTQSGQTQITQMNYVANLSIGMVVTGPGVPANTTVTGVGSNSVSISNTLTSTNSAATYVFANNGPISVSTSASTSFIPTIATVLLARRAGNVVYLGVNAAQTVLRDGEFKTLDGSGYFSLYQAPAGQNLTAGQVVYVSAGSSDGGRTAGALYPLDCSATNQAARGVYAGVVITSVLSGNTATVLYSGFFTEVGLTAGAIYYADPTTPGGITAIQPTGAGQKIVPVGFAVTSTNLLFTGAAGGGGSQSFPILATDPVSYGNGILTTFALQNQPLSGAAVRVFVDGLVQPVVTAWNLSGQNIVFTAPPAIGAAIEFEYVLAGQGYITMNQETPNNSGDNLNFTIGGQPFNKAGMSVYVDGQKLLANQWSLTLGAICTITLSSALAIGQDIYTDYFSPVSGGAGGGGSVTGAVNLDGGNGLFAGLSSGILQFKALVAGAGITISAYDDHLVLSSTGGGGGSIEAHGSASAPISLTPSVGLVPSTANDQVWWAAPTSGGAVPITAALQIAAGVTVGQRLTIKGTSATNYYTFVDGSGISANGPINLTNNQSVVFSWDGLVWSEDARRS